MKKKLLVISIGYVATPTPSDKKFVLDIVENLSDALDISVWTLNDTVANRCGEEVGHGNNGSYKLYNRNRLFHKPLGSTYKPHPTHSSIRNGLEINLSLLWYLFTHLRKTIKECKPDVIHLSDSLGPVAGLIKFFYKKIPMTITKPTVRVDGGLIYKAWIWLSLVNADVIFTFTKSAASQLQKVGLKGEKISVIPWGVQIPDEINLAASNKLIRKRYNCDNNDLLVILIPRMIGEELLEYILHIKEITKKIKATFVFAIRPTRYEDSFSNAGNDKVIIECGPKDFYDLLFEADVAIAEVGSKVGVESTSLLPLAWMESMVRQTPVLTNEGPGVDELLVDSLNGGTYKDDLELIEKISEMSQDNGLSMKVSARSSILEKFTINKIATEYFKIWGKLL